jgi:hypothetical protein
MQAKIYVTVRCVLAVTRNLSRKFKALSKEDLCCENVRVFESIGRDDVAEKIRVLWYWTWLEILVHWGNKTPTAEMPL